MLGIQSRRGCGRGRRCRRRRRARGGGRCGTRFGRRGRRAGSRTIAQGKGSPLIRLFGRVRALPNKVHIPIGPVVIVVVAKGEAQVTADREGLRPKVLLGEEGLELPSGVGGSDRSLEFIRSRAEFRTTAIHGNGVLPVLLPVHPSIIRTIHPHFQGVVLPNVSRCVCDGAGVGDDRGEVQSFLTPPHIHTQVRIVGMYRVLLVHRGGVRDVQRDAQHSLPFVEIAVQRRRLREAGYGQVHTRGVDRRGCRCRPGIRWRRGLGCPPRVGDIHEVDVLVPIVAAVENEVALTGQRVGETCIGEDEHSPLPRAGILFLDVRQRAPQGCGRLLVPVHIHVAQLPGVAPHIQVRDRNGDGLNRSVEERVVDLEPHVAVPCCLVGTACGPPFDTGGDAGIVRVQVVPHGDHVGVVGYRHRSSPGHGIVLLQVELVVPPLRVVRTILRGEIPTPLIGMSMFSQRDPCTGRRRRRHPHVPPNPVEDAQVLHPVTTPVGSRRIRRPIVKEVRVQAQVCGMFVQPVQHPPVHKRLVAQEHAIRLESQRYLLLIDAGHVVDTAQIARAVLPVEGSFLLGEQRVEGEADALLRCMELNGGPLPGGEGVRGGLLQEDLFQLPVLAERVQVPIGHLIGVIHPHLAGDAQVLENR